MKQRHGEGSGRDQIVWEGVVGGMVWYGIGGWCSIGWHGMIEYSMGWHGMVWYDRVWYDRVWYDRVWYGIL